MVVELFNAIFGCHHFKRSFPISVPCGGRRCEAATVTGTYVVCLDCGKELPYDWQEMRVIRSLKDYGSPLGSLAAKPAA